MLEIAMRFEQVFVAVQTENWEMGMYQWEKIKNRMEGAAMKRPVRTQNLEDKFLDNGSWGSLLDAFKTREPSTIRQGFMAARRACMDCHDAENAGFLNGSSVFKRTERFSP